MVLILPLNLRLTNQKKTKKNNDTIWLGGVVPHHLVAEGMITEFLQILCESQVKKIYVIGPNHKEIGGANLISDQKFIEKVKIDTEVVLKEHAVAGLKPILQQKCKKAEIIPIIVSAKTNKEEIKTLTTFLIYFIKIEIGKQT